MVKKYWKDRERHTTHKKLSPNIYMHLFPVKENGKWMHNTTI